MLSDFNILRADHPSYQPSTPSSEQQQMSGPFTGDFNSKAFDASKYIGQIFADGNYALPADLKEAAMSVGDAFLDVLGTKIRDILPNIILKDGEVIPEHVASYLLTLSFETLRPNNLQRVMNPRKYGPPREVESKFLNKFDTSQPLDEAGIAIARQIYGDNYDKSLGTTNPSDDLAFIKLMQKLLPPPRR